MNFNINHDQANPDILPVGTYEVIIEDACIDYTKGGTEHISITFVLRNDVDQKYKNRRIFHQIWRRKEPSPSDLECDGFPNQQIQQISKNVGLPNGMSIKSFDDWFELLIGKVAEITIRHEDYNNQTNAKVGYINPSKFPDCEHKYPSQTPDTPHFEDVPLDDELPF